MPGSARRAETRSVGAVRRQTLGERIPGLWVFVGLLMVLLAIAIHPALLRAFETPEPQAQMVAMDVGPNTTTSLHQVEQDLRARLRARADAQIRPAARPQPEDPRGAGPDRPQAAPEKPR